MATILPFRSKVAQASRLSSVTTLRREVAVLETAQRFGAKVTETLADARARLYAANEAAEEARMVPRNATVTDLFPHEQMTP